MLRKKSSIMNAGVYRVPKPSQTHRNNYKKLILAIVLALIFIVAELVGGIISHSIAVISDCLHLVTDLIGFVISFIALKYSTKKSTRLNSFGFHRVEIIGVLANLFIIWSLTLVVVVEAVQRVIERAIVQNPMVMLIVASGGLAVNILMYFILHSGGHSHLGHSHCKGHTHTETHEKLMNDEVNLESEKMEVRSMIDEKTQGKEHHQHNQHGSGCKHQHHDQHQHNHDNGHHDHDHDDQTQADNSLKEPLVSNKESLITIQNDQAQQQNIQKHQNSSQSKKKKKHKKPKHHHNHPRSHSHPHDHPHSQTDKPDHQNMSMKAAILHALTDIIQSIGLLISAILIYFLGSDHGAVVTEYNHWHLLDPVSTFLFSILVVISTFPITKECFHIILEATPSDFDEENLQTKFIDTEGVHDLHDFHVWSLKPGSLLLSAHVFCSETNQKKVLQRLTVLCRQHKIYHSTIQVEAIGKADYKSPVICENDIHH